MPDATPARLTGLNPAVLAATEARLRAAFGVAPAVGAREFSTAAPAGGTPAERQAGLRRLIAARSAPERLRANPPEAVARRLAKIGVPPPAAARVAGERADRSFALVEGKHTTAAVGLERIIGRNELIGVQYLDGGRAAARAVGRVVVRSAAGTLLGYGTGSLVSPRLLMTNNHVLASAAEAGPSVVEFDYQNGLDGRPVPKVTFALDPRAFFLTSPMAELDVAVVAVAPAGDGGQPLAGYGFNPLAAVEAEILDGESVTIVQHPNGEPKQIALRENRVLKLPDTADRFLYYETDTSPGSSGSPVFNDQWEVVALHHSGFPARNERGDYLTPDGQVWTADMGEQRIHWIANEGIRVAALLDFFRSARTLTADQGRLLEAVLNPPRPVVGPAEDDPRRPTAVAVPAAPPPAAVTGGPAYDPATGTAVWTIPLTVSITLGTPPAPPPPAPAPPPDPPPAARPPTPPALSAVAPVPTDAELAEARAELERAATRVYYDQPADDRDRAAYYPAALPGTLSPAALYDALHELLTRTHTTRPAYQPTRQVYPWVDLQPTTLKIKSVYSGQTFEPLELMRMDAEVARTRAERVAAGRAAEAAYDPAREAARVDLLEAQLPYNCEHVVPQSWFGKKEPMRGDVHHLFACESGCNSFRGNTPYFDFNPAPEAARAGCGRREQNKFEPTAGKGAVARATLYFLLRYPGEIDRTAAEYTPDRIATLLAWHRAFPVGEYERHRNQAIFAVQGNRNPLIDHPDWADKIDFLKGLG